jgi:hypothetical protein
MEMKKLFVFLLIAVLLSACSPEKGGSEESESIMKEPPVLNVSSNGNEAVAVLGTYSWSYDNGDGTYAGIEADSNIPPKMVAYQMESLRTKLSSDIELEFANPPQEIRVTIWNDSQEEREVEIEGATFNADEKGDIVYEIYAKWAQGSAHYAIELNVQ